MFQKMFLLKNLMLHQQEKNQDKMKKLLLVSFTIMTLNPLKKGMLEDMYPNICMMVLEIL